MAAEAPLRSPKLAWPLIAATTALFRAAIDPQRLPPAVALTPLHTGPYEPQAELARRRSIRK